MLQAQKLQGLLDTGAKEEAITLCREQIASGRGVSYYKFWLAKLENEGVPLKPALVSVESVKVLRQLDAEIISSDIRTGFSKSIYKTSGSPASAEASLESRKEKLVKELPFKGDIYLPTAKIPLSEQVAGLQRVSELQSPDNLQVSKERFNSLKSILKATGRKRVFVIGNGPSLKKTDLALLRDEITIGFNGIFLHDSFTPTIYVVEDHLVAEDRVKEIHDYKCPVKVFPSYLGYCIQPQENTLFLRHMPRISYPVDTDFSANAGDITYAGGTVTYTGLQLAASLGFDEIILIGVDASYQVHNVDRSETYGTGVLTSNADDTNHFDSRYFGKGYRWHDPNVDKMLQAYRKAKYWAYDSGVSIKNATIGGQLEVFPRVDLYKLFPQQTAYPRLGVIDFTSVNRVCATGIVKKNLFADWDASAILHIHSDNSKLLSAFQSCENDLYEKGRDEFSPWPAFRSLVEFDPQVLYLRPTPDCVHVVAVQVLAAALLGKPWVVHYMDDWLEKVRINKSAELADAYEDLLRILIVKAAAVLSICPKMSGFLVEKYDLPAQDVLSVHNFVQPLNLLGSGSQKSPENKFVMRFFGGLEPDMGLSTLIEVARQTDALNASGGVNRREVVFEIFTAKHYIEKHKSKFEEFAATTLNLQSDSYQMYLDRLSGSDLNLICYNFDDASVKYVRYSMANKLPELLSVSAPFLAIGDGRIGTIELLSDVQYPLLFTKPGFDLGSTISALLEVSDDFRKRYQSAHSKLIEEFSDHNNKFKLYFCLRRAAAKSSLTVDATARRQLYQIVSVLLNSAAPKWQENGDLGLICRLLLLPRELVDKVLAKIRAHGLSWSVRDLMQSLKKVVKSVEVLEKADAAIQADAVALLICGLKSDRYEEVNRITSEWVMKMSVTNA